MPTYEYACAACGHAWEAVQRISEPPLEACPKCAKAAAQRLISGANFILKGGGWYSDLYSSTKPATKKSDSNGGTTSDSTPKAESKSEASDASKTAKPAKPAATT